MEPNEDFEIENLFIFPEVRLTEVPKTLPATCQDPLNLLTMLNMIKHNLMQSSLAQASLEIRILI